MNTGISEISSLIRAEFDLTQITALLYFVAACINMGFWFSKKPGLQLTSYILSVIATLTMTSVMVLRTINVGHVPYVSLYETFMMMTWCFSVIAVFADKFTKNAIPTSVANIVGTLALAYIITWPEENRLGFHLRPALQSPWLWIHVAMMFVSYGGFAISAGAALVHLFNKSPKADELSYRLVMFAFPILGLGVTLGAVWAHEAWGRYWGWDPKETAALITWFVYAAYIHVRLVAGWTGPKVSWLNLVGFGAVMFTWVGLEAVNKIIDTGSLHVYTGG